MSSTTEHQEYHDGKRDETSSAASSHHVEEAGEKQAGVLTAEAASAVVGWKIWAIYLGIALTAYVTGLDNNTMVSRSEDAPHV